MADGGRSALVLAATDSRTRRLARRGHGLAPRRQAPGRSGVDGIHLRPGRPLLATSARPWAGALLACCAILVAVLGVLFAHQDKAGWLDHAVDSPIITWVGGHRGLALWLAAPGSLIPAAVLSAVIVAACLLTGRLNGAVLAAAAIPASVGLAEGLQAPGPPHLSGRAHLSERTCHSHVRACRHGHGAVSHLAAPG